MATIPAPSVKLAVCCTVKTSAGLTLAYIVQAREHVLPIEADIPIVENLAFREG